MSAGSTVPATPFPIDAERAARLDALVADLDATALAWVSGYAAGLAAERSRGGSRSVAPAPLPRSEAVATATVLYASQTGNGRRLAERLGKALEAAGLHAAVVSAADFVPKKLADERLVFLVSSTHGDGEPPDDARALYEFLNGRRAPKLEQLAYAVLALGDSSYPQFCATGRVLDERLAALGARRLYARVDCDVDFEPLAAPWLEQAVASARAELGASGAGPRLAVVTPLRPAAHAAATREAPVEAELIANQRLTARDADQDVRHLELALPANRFDYEAGDALGVVLENPAESVARVLELARLDAGTPVAIDGVALPLGTWLAEKREVTRLAKPFVERLAERSGSADLQALLAPGEGERLRHLFKEQQVADLLQRHPADWDAEALVRALHPLTPRLYSIASSRRAVEDEAHLTVAVVNYAHAGERRYGAASWQLAKLAAGATVKAYVEPNPRFRVPVDGARDVIMIGPGTGVAPFRGFLQQRIADGARGRNWLFYGGRHLERDFHYQVEWLDALKRGQLHRLDVAFSRDQAQKLYVQHRLREHGAEVYRWLENGAHVYVCGDAERMAPDVNAALVAIVAAHGGRDEEGAREYVANLAAEKRYARDVY